MTNPTSTFWVSDDLITWKRYSCYSPDLKQVPDYPSALPRIGAPKLFFDLARSRVPADLAHHTRPRQDRLAGTLLGGSADIVCHFRGPADLLRPPRKFFPWDMATIDVTLCQQGDAYYAILKDERYPTLDWPTGKTIRVCRSRNLLGPYSEPGPPVSPNFREAPTIIPSPNGKAWYLYYEQYPGVAYGLSVAADLNGPWVQVAGGQRPDWDKYYLSPGVRHGSMLPVTRKQYDALVAAFSRTPKP